VQNLEASISLCDPMNPGGGYQIRITHAAPPNAPVVDVLFTSRNPATGEALLTYEQCLDVLAMYRRSPSENAARPMLTKETAALGAGPHINDAFASFFKLLGYGVTYEGKRATGERWHEIYDDEGLICQVSFGTPLAEFLADLPYLIESKPGIGPTNYWYACEDKKNKKLLEMLARVREAKAHEHASLIEHKET
jgi:hypothetical protein